MKRKIAAGLAFNVYALVLIQAFWAATPLLFHKQEIARLKNLGVSFKFDEWGWGDHYLWRLFAAVVSTTVAALICGAIAKEKGGKVSLLANIPSVLGWVGYACMFFFLLDNVGIKGNDKQEGLKIAYGVVSVVAIPVTCWLAMKFGEIGEQTNLPDTNSTFGIGVWHWAWIWLPLCPYGYQIISYSVTFIMMEMAIWNDRSLSNSLLSLLRFAIVAAWIAPLVLSYQTLSGKRFQTKSPPQRGAMIAAILIGGYFFATAVPNIFDWILGYSGS